MDSQNIVFSIDEEFYNYTHLNEAVEIACDERSNIQAGSEIIIWAGTPDQPKASKYIGDISDTMMDNAANDVGECADGWPPSNELNKVVAAAVDKWCDENNAHPHFYRVENVKEILIRIDDPKKYEFTVLENPFASTDDAATVE